MGLTQWADYLPSSLSGGMQQRVGLARALATDADILLMDEPFSALDPLIRREMQDELLRLQKQLNKTIVFISHDIHEALKLGDHIGVMKDGYIVQIGTPEELITQPADEYIRAFIQDVNRAQVITASSIARQATPLVLSQDSTKEALAQMVDSNLQHLYVVDEYGKPIGILHKPTLEIAVQQKRDDVTSFMETDFPKVNASTCIENIFHLYEQGLPVAVVDDERKFKGVVEESDILASIGKF